MEAFWEKCFQQEKQQYKGLEVGVPRREHWGISKCSYEWWRGCVEGNIRGAGRHSTEGLENSLYFDWNGKLLASTDYKNNGIGSASEKPQLTPV